MTICKYPQIAFIHKRRDFCKKIFVFEGYQERYKYIFGFGSDVPMIMCKKCAKEVKENGNDN